MAKTPNVATPGECHSVQCLLPHRDTTWMVKTQLCRWSDIKEHRFYLLNFNFSALVTGQLDHSSCQILLPRYLMNSWNNFVKTDRQYSLVRTDDLIRFCRSEVTAGRRRQILWTQHLVNYLRAVLGIFIWVGKSKTKQILGRPTGVVYVGIMGMTRAVWVGQERVWVGRGLPALIARTASGSISMKLKQGITTSPYWWPG